MSMISSNGASPETHDMSDPQEILFAPFQEHRVC
jgi:hypothetical protein